METDFQRFISQSKISLCRQYAERLDKCHNKKSMIDLALDANGMPWICEAVRDGKLSMETITEDFGQFANGGYMRDIGGYTSSLWCGDELDEIHVNTTAALIIGFNGRVLVNGYIAELYLAACDCMVETNGKVNAYLYDSRIASTKGTVVVTEK